MKRPIIDIPCVPLTGCVGKTIAAVVDQWDYTAIRFTDGSVACFGVCGDNASMQEPETLPVVEFGRPELVASGIVAQAQFDAHDAAMSEWYAAEAERKEADERAQFERLRAKFGGGK